MDREGLRVVPEAAPGVEEESAQPAEQGALTGTAPSDHGGQRPVIPGRDRRAGDAAPAAARHARAARGRIMALSARLTGEMTIWLTTVGRDGTPQPNPAGFLWDGGDSLR